MDQQLKNGNYTILNSGWIFNREGEHIRPETLMDKDTYVLNQTAYNDAQPIYITTMFARTSI